MTDSWQILTSLTILRYIADNAKDEETMLKSVENAASLIGLKTDTCKTKYMLINKGSVEIRSRDDLCIEGVRGFQHLDQIIDREYFHRCRKVAAASWNCTGKKAKDL